MDHVQDGRVVSNTGKKSIAVTTAILGGTRNSSGDDIAERDISVYLFIVQLYINSCCIVNK